MLYENEKLRIDSIIRSHLTGFAEGFKARHIGEVENPFGVVNIKKQNIFMSVLPSEFIFYSALVRSFDSSFGNVLEDISLEIARINYQVSQEVVGMIDIRQKDHISDILNNYKEHNVIPEISHYKNYNTPSFALKNAKHKSDNLFFDKEKNEYHIIELKAGGDLDNKKARAEKEALLEQYFILKNINQTVDVNLHFATAYNKFGEGRAWTQKNVETFFARDELLIGKDFWNFVCKDENGFDYIIASYNNSAHIITQALTEVKEAYGI